jgi:MSHA biogenesis protein MshM
LYLEFFGLTDPPFRITPNTNYWFEGGQRGDLLATLEYAIGHGEGLIKVVGEVGSGKTMLCRMLQQRLPDNIDTVYLGNPTLNPDEVVGAILADLGVTAPALENRQRLLDQLNNALLSRHSNGRRVVVFIEEAQGMTLESLEFTRLLTNLETASDKLLQIVLFGQPELDHLLADPRIRQFKDRITLNLTLPPLSEAETNDYLRSRLQIAGYRGPDLFSKAVVRRIATLSDGLSRRINILADKTLLAAYGNNTHNIRPDHVIAAAKDAEITTWRKPRGNTRIWVGALTGAVAGLALLAFTAWFGIGESIPAGKPSHVDAKEKAVQLPVIYSAANADAAEVINPVTADATGAINSVEASLAAVTSAVADDAEGLSPALETAFWIRSAPANTFVIQILTAKDEAEAAALLKGMHGRLPQPLRGFRANTPNGTAWLVIAGEYADRVSALSALARLPGDIRAQNPFLRTVGKIRATLAHEDTHARPSNNS